MTSSNPAYKRRRIDLTAPPQLPVTAAPQTPPALTAFHVGAAAAAAGALPQPPGGLMDQPITGTVEARFDAGYFVSIVAGGQEFRGKTLPPLQPCISPSPHFCSGAGMPDWTSTCGGGREARRSCYRAVCCKPVSKPK